jgi:hypothetical protein
MPSELLYPFIGAIVALIVGGMIAFQAGNKLGYLIMAGAMAFMVYTFMPVARKASSNRPVHDLNSGGYTRK